MKIKRLGLYAAKGLLAVNLAAILRVLRRGPRSTVDRLMQAYHAVDPFSRWENRAELLLLQRIPLARLEDLAAWPEELRLDLRYADLSGSTPVSDLAAIVALAMAQRPAAVLEFGTFWGSATANLARNLPQARIHTIDLPPDAAEAAAVIEGQPVDDPHLIASRQLGKAFRGTPLAERIVQHLGDTARYDYSVIKDSLSFFLIDGSHTYEYAKSDTLKAFALAQGPSTFCWHDCDEAHPGVTRWLGELLDAGLPVRRVAGTVVACLRIDAGDLTIRQLAR